MLKFSRDTKVYPKERANQLSKEQTDVWSRYGFIGHMLEPYRYGPKTFVEVVEACHKYNDQEKEPPIDPAEVAEGLLRLADVSLIQVHTEQPESARESYEMCIAANSPLSDMSKSVIRGFFLTVFDE